MTNALISYQFEDESLRVTDENGDPWFIATDVARILGYRDAPNMLRNLDDDEQHTHKVSRRSANGVEQVREVAIISESGLYAAILKSRRPEAKRFRKWVTSEVLPSIRKTGAYSIDPTPPAPPPVAGRIDTPRLSAGIAAVREARRLYGPAAARRVWAELGLPVGIVPAGEDEEGFRQSIAAYVGNATEVRVVDVAEALGVSNPDRHMVSRIKAALIELGFAEYVIKRRGRMGRAWQRRGQEV